ncbi:MAG: AarF/ABC1/UbiB kinase family protein, partial [Cyanobacteria bacterium J06632_22]
MSTVSEQSDMMPSLPTDAASNDRSAPTSHDASANGTSVNGAVAPALVPLPPKPVYPSERKYRWNRRYSRIERSIDIWSFFLKFLSKRWLYGKRWSYAGAMTPEKQTARRRAQAVWIRQTFLNLGPTFIKLGQLFSTRADLFPAEYVEELSKLQDEVPAFSYEQAR